MLNQTAIAKCLKVLGDETRLKIVELLDGRKLCACELLEKLSISQGTLSHHMKQLTELELVSCEKQGKWCHYELNTTTLEEISSYLSSLQPSSGNIQPCKRPRIAFICIQNSCRSQMAEAFARREFGESFEVYSAGTEIADEVNKTAVQIMRAHFGLDISSQRPKTLEDVGPVDVAVTMGCGIACPAVFAKRHVAWEIADPKDMDEAGFVEVAREIERQVKELAVELRDFVGCCE